jgi:hypothetical protein
MAEEYFTNDRVKEWKGFNLVSKDPFGFWHIENPNGPTPKELAVGEFTDWALAARQVDKYVSGKQDKENKPPQDKNTRKVQEVLKAREQVIRKEEVVS